MRAFVVVSILTVIAVLTAGCVKEEVRPDPPKRPVSVPPSAVWAGGVDGGAFIDCAVKDAAAFTYACTTYDDGVGEVWKRGVFALKRSEWDEAKQAPLFHDVTAAPAPLPYEGFDGEVIFLADSLVLVPVSRAP